MQAFDIVLKLLLQQSKQILPQLANLTVVNWLPTELPRLQNRRLDLLGRASDGTLLHFVCWARTYAHGHEPAGAVRIL